MSPTLNSVKALWLLILLARPAAATEFSAPKPVTLAVPPLALSALPTLPQVRVDRAGSAWELVEHSNAHGVEQGRYENKGRSLWLTKALSPNGFLIKEYAEKPTAIANETGVASFSLKNGVLVSNVESTGATLINAKAEFKAAVSRFDGELEGIKGTWVFGDNLEEFNRLRKLGRTPEEAALGTWTGKRAVEAGFTKVTFSPERLEQLRTDVPGEHEKMAVLFSRPDK